MVFSIPESAPGASGAGIAIPDAAAMEALVASRRSTRGFMPTAVPRTVIGDILRIASRTPSGSNIQPWRVYVVMHDTKIRLTDAIMADRAAGAPDPVPEYLYPEATREPWLSRRRKVGWDLYRELGIVRGDLAAARRQIEKNYDFFGAPVGLIYTLDRDLGQGAFIELGMFMQTVMLVARSFGLHTCPQAAFAFYHDLLRRQLGIPANEMVMCGMALGHIDPDEPANRLVTVREPVEAFVTFVEA